MIDVIYEDNHILVVIKPQNIPSQEDSSEDKDMLTLVKEYIKEKYNKPGNVYAGLVHRLDRPTGGVMVFAKTSKAAARLSESIKTNEITKTYLTIVNGTPKVSQQKLTDYLKKNEKTEKFCLQKSKYMLYCISIVVQSAPKRRFAITYSHILRRIC